MSLRPLSVRASLFKISDRQTLRVCGEIVPGPFAYLWSIIVPYPAGSPNLTCVRRARSRLFGVMVPGPPEHVSRALPAHQTLRMCGERVRITYRNVLGALLRPRNLTYVDPARFLLSHLVARLLSGPLMGNETLCT